MEMWGSVTLDERLIMQSDCFYTNTVYKYVHIHHMLILILNKISYPIDSDKSPSYGNYNNISIAYANLID